MSNFPIPTRTAGFKAFIIKDNLLLMFILLHKNHIFLIKFMDSITNLIKVHIRNAISPTFICISCFRVRNQVAPFFSCLLTIWIYCHSTSRNQFPCVKPKFLALFLVNSNSLFLFTCNNYFNIKINFT